MKEELKKISQRLQAFQIKLDKQEEANQKLIAALKNFAKKSTSISSER